MYSATYKQKKVIKLAPDAIVQVEGSPLIEICPDCKRQIKISDYLQNVTTNLSTSGVVGTASFTIAMPRHGHEGRYMVRGGRVFGINLMNEIEIFIKARFPNANGVYEYYKCFWGVVVGIDERYTAGTQEITINCESMIKWLQLMKTNEHPSTQAFTDTEGKWDDQAILWASKTYANKNPFEIIYQMMSITFMNIVIPNMYNDEGTDATFTDKNGKTSTVKLPIIGTQDKKLTEAWAKKFDKFRTELKMYSVTDDDIKQIASANEPGNQTRDTSISASDNPATPIAISYNATELFNFRPFRKPDEAQDLDFIKNTFKSNLTIIEEVKMFSGFEFYLDTTGKFIFKPPFWNLDVRNNKLYVLDDTEILNWAWTESEAEVVTRVEVTGAHFQEVNVDSYFIPKAVFTNYALAQQFGIKVESVTQRFFTTTTMCYAHAISELDRYNSNRFKGSVTIIGRPELRLGIPVYFTSRDCFAYIDNISHNFSFGGPFTTTLTLSAVRRKYERDRENLTKAESSGDKKVDIGSEEYFLILDKENLTADDIQAERQAEKEAKENVQEAVQRQYKKDEIAFKEAKKTGVNVEAVGKKLAANGDTLKSNRTGVYKEYHISSPKAQKIVQDFKMAKRSQKVDAYLEVLEKAIPLSDREGYELVGIYENGKSLWFDKGNVLRQKTEETQKALSKEFTAASAAGMGVDDRGDPNMSMGYSVDTIQDPVPAIEGFFAYQAKSLAELDPATASGVDNSCRNCGHPGLKRIITKSVSTEKINPIDKVSKSTNKTYVSTETKTASTSPSFADLLASK